MWMVIALLALCCAFTFGMALLSQKRLDVTEERIRRLEKVAQMRYSGRKPTEEIER